MPYLLSIELREGDDARTIPGEVVLLAQCWCDSLPDVIEEYEVRNGLTGKRLLDQIEAAFRAGLGKRSPALVGVAQNEIAADPRRERTP